MGLFDCIFFRKVTMLVIVVTFLISNSVSLLDFNANQALAGVCLTPWSKLPEILPEAFMFITAQAVHGRLIENGFETNRDIYQRQEELKGIAASIIREQSKNSALQVDDIKCLVFSDRNNPQSRAYYYFFTGANCFVRMSNIPLVDDNFYQVIKGCKIIDGPRKVRINKRDYIQEVYQVSEGYTDFLHICLEDIYQGYKGDTNDTQCTLEDRLMEYVISKAEVSKNEGDIFPVYAVIYDSEGNVIAEDKRRFLRREPNEKALPVHAEVVAISQAIREGKTDWHNYTLVVNMEPCHGCAIEIAARGFRRCIIGHLDPNPFIYGEGMKYLQWAGVEVAFPSQRVRNVAKELFGIGSPERFENIFKQFGVMEKTEQERLIAQYRKNLEKEGIEIGEVRPLDKIDDIVTLIKEHLAYSEQGPYTFAKHSEFERLVMDLASCLAGESSLYRSVVLYVLNGNVLSKFENFPLARMLINTIAWHDINLTESAKRKIVVVGDRKSSLKIISLSKTLKQSYGEGRIYLLEEFDSVSLNGLREFLVREDVIDMYSQYRLLQYHIYSDDPLESFMSDIEMTQEDLQLKPTVDFMEIHPTNVCNLMCSWCTYNQVHEKRAISFEALDNIARFKPSEILVVGGGEPTMYRDGEKDFNDFILKLRELLSSARIRLATNGTYIPRGRWIEEIYDVGVSIHGTTKDSFQRNTGRDKFDEMLDNLFNGYILNSPVHRIVASAVYSKNKLGGILSFVEKYIWPEWKRVSEILRQKGVKKDFFFLLLPYADDSSPDNPYYNSILTYEERVEWARKLEEVRITKPEFWNFIERHAPDFIHKPFEMFTANPCYYCWMVTNYILAAANGNFYPCFLMTIFQQNPLGSLFDSPEQIRERRLAIINNLSQRCRKGCRVVNTLMGRKVLDYLREKESYSIDAGLIFRGDIKNLVKELEKSSVTDLRLSVDRKTVVNELGKLLIEKRKVLMNAFGDAQTIGKIRQAIADLEVFDIKEFDSIVLGRDKPKQERQWLLGFNSLAPPMAEYLQKLFPRPTLGYAREALDSLSGDALLEYLLHEALCRYVGHYEAREIQEILFEETNYRDAKGIPCRKNGILGEVLGKLLDEVDYTSDIKLEAEKAVDYFMQSGFGGASYVYFLELLKGKKIRSTKVIEFLVKIIKENKIDIGIWFRESKSQMEERDRVRKLAVECLMQEGDLSVMPYLDEVFTYYMQGTVDQGIPLVIIRGLGKFKDPSVVSKLKKFLNLCGKTSDFETEEDSKIARLMDHEEFRVAAVQSLAEIGTDEAHSVLIEFLDKNIDCGGEEIIDKRHVVISTILSLIWNIGKILFFGRFSPVVLSKVGLSIGSSVLDSIYSGLERVPKNAKVKEMIVEILGKNKVEKAKEVLVKALAEKFPSLLSLYAAIALLEIDPNIKLDKYDFSIPPLAEHVRLAKYIKDLVKALRNANRWEEGKMSDIEVYRFARYSVRKPEEIKRGSRVEEYFRLLSELEEKLADVSRRKDDEEDDREEGLIARGNPGVLYKELEKQKDKITDLRQEIDVKEIARQLRDLLDKNRAKIKDEQTIQNIQQAINDLEAFDIVEFSAIVLGVDKPKPERQWFLGFNSIALPIAEYLQQLFPNPTLGYAREVLDNLTGDALLEYLLHEALCRYTGHYEARRIQEILFEETNYRSAKGEPGRKEGVVNKVLSRIIDGTNNRIIIFDVRGTLVDKGEFKDFGKSPVREAIVKLLEQGYWVGINTTGMVEIMRKDIIQHIPIHLRQRIIGYFANSSQKYKFDSEGKEDEDISYREINGTDFRPEDIPVIEEIIKEAKKYYTSLIDEVLKEEPDFILRHKEKYRNRLMRDGRFEAGEPEYRGRLSSGRVAMIAVPNFSSKDIIIDKGYPRDIRAEVIEYINEELDKRCGGRYKAKDGGGSTIDINRVGISKGICIRDLIENEGFLPENIVFIADNLTRDGDPSGDVSVLGIKGVTALSVCKEQDECHPGAVWIGNGPAATLGYIKGQILLLLQMPLSNDLFLREAQIVVRQAAVIAGDIMRKFKEEKVDKLRSEQKEIPYSIVTEADREIQKGVVALIRSHFPEHGILGEEVIEGVDTKRDAEYIWVIDPIDGTKSFVDGRSDYCFLISLLHNREPVLSLVYAPEWNVDGGSNSALFEAVEGIEGAYLNGKKIHVSNVLDFEKQKILITRDREGTGGEEKMIAEGFGQILRTDRCQGLDMIKVAMSHEYPMPIVYTHTMPKIWDAVASIFIVLKAGGVVTGLDGRPVLPISREEITKRIPRFPTLIASSDNANRVLINKLIYKLDLREYDIDDMLDYNGLVGKLADYILGYQSSSGKSVYMVSIDGMYGIGKSTLMKRLQEELQRRGRLVDTLERDWFLMGREEWKRQFEQWLNDRTQPRPGAYRDDKFMDVLDRIKNYKGDTPLSISMDELFNKEDDGRLSMDKTITIGPGSIVLVEAGRSIEEPWKDYFGLRILLIGNPNLTRSRVRKREKDKTEQEFNKRYTEVIERFTERVGETASGAHLIVILDDFNRPVLIKKTPIPYQKWDIEKIRDEGEDETTLALRVLPYSSGVTLMVKEEPSGRFWMNRTGGTMPECYMVDSQGNQHLIGTKEERENVQCLDLDAKNLSEDAVVIPYGNLYMNSHFVAFANGRIYHCYGEPLEERTYTSFVVWKDGRKSIERLRYVEGEIDQPDKVYLADSPEEDIADKIHCAFFGQQIVKDGILLTNASSIVEEFDDLNQVVGEFPVVDGGQTYSFNDLHSNPHKAKDLIRRGLTKPALYPHSIIGITREGGIVILAIAGQRKKGAGVTIEEAARIAKGKGLVDAIILANGGDVNIYNNGNLVCQSGPEHRVSSFIIIKPDVLQKMQNVCLWETNITADGLAEDDGGTILNNVLKKIRHEYGTGIFAVVDKIKVIEGTMGQEFDGTKDTIFLNVDTIEDEDLLYLALMRELIRSIMSVIPCESDEVRRLAVDYISLKIADERGIKMADAEMERLFLDKIKDAENRYKAAIDVFNDIVEAKGMMGKVRETEDLAIRVIKTFTGIRVKGLDKLSKRLAGIIAGSVKVASKLHEIASLPLAMTEGQYYILLDRERIPDGMKEEWEKEISELEKGGVFKVVGALDEAPKGSKIIHLIDPGDIKDEMPKGILYLPMPYLRSSLYMAAAVVVAGGEVNSINLLVKGLIGNLYSQILGRHITEEDLERLFKAPWLLLPEIRSVLGEINRLRSALVEIEKAA